MNNRPSPSFLNRERIIVAAFFAIFIFLLYQAARLVTPFVTSIIWAAVVVIVLYPLYEKLRICVKGKENLAAGLMTLFTLVLVIGPAVLLFMLLTAQAADLYTAAADFVQSGRLTELWNRVKTSTMGYMLSYPFLAELDVKSRIIKGLSDLSTAVAGQLGALLKNILLAILDLFIMLFVIFFFFRDGKKYTVELVAILPFPEGQKKPVMEKLVNTFSAVINGLFLVALFQGIMTGLGFFIVGVPFPVFWGFLTCIASLLPVGGSALIWVPGALYLFFTGSTTRAILLLIWGVVLVSLPDNFLRPLLIGRKAKLPTFFLFLGILGGIQTYGILGILFGPLVVTLLTAFLQIYREEYAER